MAFYSISRSTETASPVPIHCPICIADTQGEPLAVVETVKLLLFLRLFTKQSVFVRCLSCNRWLSTSLPFEQIGSVSLEERNQRIFPGVSFVGKVVTILSLLLFWFVFFSPLLAGLALVMTWRSPGWRKAAWVALALSILALLGVIIILAMPPTRH